MVFASPMAARRPDQPLTFCRLSSAAPGDQPDRHDDCVVALRALGESTRARIVGMLIEEPLDLGCCSFQFDQPVAATDRLASGPPRKRSVGRPRRFAR
jgi:hypothetical protein